MRDMSGITRSAFGLGVSLAIASLPGGALAWKPERAVGEFVAGAESEFGAIDVAINNAVYRSGHGGNPAR